GELTVPAAWGRFGRNPNGPGAAMLLLSDKSAESRRLLDEEIANPFHITMLVFGADNGDVASRADVRAQALASTRRVVWIQDTNLLKADERNLYSKDGTAIVCALDLDNTPAAWLARPDAESFLKLERAFLAAQQGAGSNV